MMLPSDQASPKRRILIVDDHHDTAYYMATLFADDENETQIAANGIKALEIASKFHPHFIFMDLNMPKLDGNDACSVIRSQPWGRDIVLIAITGFDRPEVRKQAKSAGFDHYFTKPLNLKELEKVLAESPHPMPK